MLRTQVLRDWKGRIVGYIDIDEKGNKIIKDDHRIILGYYDAKRDVTTNFGRVVLAKGDLSSLLLNFKQQ